MAQLIVRNLEETVKQRLRRRAKANGRSMEEEVRVIIREAVVNHTPSNERGLGTELRNVFADVHRGFRVESKNERPGFGTRFASHFADLDEPFKASEWNEAVKLPRFRR